MSIGNTLLFSNDFSCIEGVHRDQKVIWIQKNEYKDIKVLKTKTKVHWSNSSKKWYLIDTKVNRKLINFSEPVIGKSALMQIHPNNQEAFLRFREMLVLKGYSINTVRTYVNEFAQLLYILKHHCVEEMTEEKIRSYLAYCLEELGHSENQVHSRINALKFYFEKVLFRDKIFLGIPRPKKPALLPKHLSENEIQKILEVTENPKHLLIIKMCYGMGLRVSEIAALKIEHINTKDMKILIASAKGKKDRYVFLPETLLVELKAYYRFYLPKIYIFEGAEGFPLSVRTVQSVFKTSMKKAGIHRNVGIHCLRHSYATHLLEYGTDISHIQKLLGHNNIKTTLNYTRVTDKNLSKVISPLDRIQNQKSK